MGLVARTAVCVDRLPVPHMYDTPILLQDPFHVGGSRSDFCSCNNNANRPGRVAGFATTSLHFSHFSGWVASSSALSNRIASSALVPHISGCGRRRTHTAGRSGLPYSAQRLSAVNWTQRTPAGLPCGIPGIGDEIEGAMQQAPHPTRHSIACSPQPERIVSGQECHPSAIRSIRNPLISRPRAAQRR